MAPMRSKKRTSTESNSSVDLQKFPAPPQAISTKTRSPIKKSTVSITLGQKQALIDNLQLEITERARKLRAQYMLQAQGLRTRIEIRVNRIPMALRKANMGDLWLKYGESATKPMIPKAQVSPRGIQSPPAQPGHNNTRANPSPLRGMKRLSDDISSMDKENEDMENPKKRPRRPIVPPARKTSKVQTSQVLSPRSANSRTLPRSPIRPAVSSGKSILARPVSPLKPTAPVPAGGAASILTNMAGKAKSRRGAVNARKVTEQGTSTAGTGRGRKAAAPLPPLPKQESRRAASDSSNGSTSSQHTVVKNPVVAPTDERARVKRTVMGTIKGMGPSTKKAPAPKSAAPGTGTRVLRKRI